ncbi:phospholipase D-like domain-containing protein [Flagellimonas flava]|uniref:phospholipase D-like domain-containing protein n=1 Tax=Flagellimonas flava TaxID=570519 RepID=UPI003D64CA3A
MYFNNAQCDVYIGRGAGKKLMSEMASAQTSVRIVSPFLSEHLIGGLEELHEKGIQVELITVEGNSHREHEALAALFQQHVHVDGTARNRRKRIRMALHMGYAFVGLGMVCGWYFLSQQLVVAMLYLLAGMGILGLSLVLLRKAIRNIRIYSYSYASNFPLKVIRNYDGHGQRTTYLHSKIYIIDDQIAYLGSLNFTYSGTESNYETRVRLTDRESVCKIVEEFRYLMDEAPFPESDFSVLAIQYFREPIN